MATVNPAGRANYEPNSWSAGEGGPREDPASGFHTYPADDARPKRRLRPESFADHYSQARQFYISQTGIEQRHIGDAVVFELSKCDNPAIRIRMVAGLRNVHEDLAQYVADGLGLGELPGRAEAAREPITDLPASSALSILANGPGSFAGRKIGVLVAGGADAALINDLQAAAEQEGATVEMVAPAVGGIDTSDGKRIEADQQIDGSPGPRLVSCPGLRRTARRADWPPACWALTDAAESVPPFWPPSRLCPSAPTVLPEAKLHVDAGRPAARAAGPAFGGD